MGIFNSHETVWSFILNGLSEPWQREGLMPFICHEHVLDILHVVSLLFFFFTKPLLRSVMNLSQVAFRRSCMINLYQDIAFSREPRFPPVGKVFLQMTSFARCPSPQPQEGVVERIFTDKQAMVLRLWMRKLHQKSVWRSSVSTLSRGNKKMTLSCIALLLE